MAAFLAFTATPASAPAQLETIYGDVMVAAERQRTDSGGHGYTEYGYTIANTSPMRSHRVTLALPGDNHGYEYNQLHSIRCTADIGPGRRVRMVLYQPSDPHLSGQRSGRHHRRPPAGPAGLLRAG